MIAGLVAACSADDGSADPIANPPTQGKAPTAGSDAAPCASAEDTVLAAFAVPLQECKGCHARGGLAQLRGSQYVVYDEAYPGFLAKNAAGLATYGGKLEEGTSVLLRKAQGIGHGGGKIFDVSVEEERARYDILAAAVAATGTTKTECAPAPQGTTLLLDREETLRKAAIVLGAPFPSESEFAAASAGTDEQLAARVLAFTNAEGFYELVREMWNDVLLTDSAGGSGLDPSLYAPWKTDPTTQKRVKALPAEGLPYPRMTAFRQEPLRYIEQVVRENRPFSEILSTNQVVVNDFTATAYFGKGLVPEPDLNQNPSAWMTWRMDTRPTEQSFRMYGSGAERTTMPKSAGILTTQAFLDAWSTTSTNRSRNRIRGLYDIFLGTSIFGLAERPIDSTVIDPPDPNGPDDISNNPMQSNNACTVCHAVMDPLAGGFRNHPVGPYLPLRPDPGTQFPMNWATTYDQPNEPAVTRMLPAGYDGVPMPESERAVALPWLGAKIASDPRFPQAVVRVFFRAIIGRDLLALPQPSEVDYPAKLRAFAQQRAFVGSVAESFARGGMNVRPIVTALVMSPYFRAKSVSDAASSYGFGTGRLLTPEMLGRKYRVTLGRYFYASGDPGFVNESSFVLDYGDFFQHAKDGFRVQGMKSDAAWRLVLGGIDSVNATKRVDAMSAFMLAANEYTATLTACRAVSAEFGRPLEKRSVLRDVRPDMVPGTHDAELKRAISALHFRFLGTRDAPASAEVAETFAIFQASYNERKAAQDKKLPAVCVRPDLGTDYDDLTTKFAVAGNDAFYTQGAWRSVLTLLATDYRFTHE